MIDESNTKQKRIFRGAVLAAVVLMLAALLCVGAGAAATASGSCGDSLTWELIDGTLTIYGTGEMGGDGFPQWSAHKSEITTVIINEGVTNIGNNAFQSCWYLTSITIPSSVTSIGSGAFEQCSRLTSIKIPSSVTSIGSGAFEHCSGLTSIEILASVTSIGEKAFSSCTHLTSITIPDTVTSIGVQAFWECSHLTTVTFPDNSELTTIGNSAFNRCTALTSIKIPAGVTSIGDYTFYDCKALTSIEIPTGVTSIGVQAFDSCKGLTSIKIPSNVTSIGNFAFQSCKGLTTVTFPDDSKLTTIGEKAFQLCSGLTSIEIPSNVTSIGEGAFWELADNSIIYYACALSEWSYKYTASKTALAKNNGDGSYTFTSAVSTLSLSQENAPAGGVFYRWYKAPLFTEDNKVDKILSSESPKTLWLGQIHTVTYDGNGNNSGNVPTDSTQYGHGSAVTVLGNTGSLAKTGYTFGGWNLNSTSGELKQAGNTFTISKDTVLYANWTANTYTVTFDANGGVGSMNDQSFTYDISQNLNPNNFTKSGFTFVGWSTVLNGAVTYTDGESVKNLAETDKVTVTLYAVWKEEKAPVQSHSSRNDGYSIWLPATAEPTAAPTEAQPTQAVPTASPVKPTPAPATPAPFIGLLAGLAAADVLFGLRRK